MPSHGLIISNLNKIFDRRVSWLSTRSSARQLGLFCLHCLFKCCGGVGWFFLSGRLRRDCHPPYAAYLENMRWHARPCVCQSFIARPKLLPLFLLRGDAGIVSISSCVRPRPPDCWDLAHGVVWRSRQESRRRAAPTCHYHGSSGSFYCGVSLLQ